VFGFCCWTVFEASALIFDMAYAGKLKGTYPFFLNVQLLVVLRGSIKFFIIFFVNTTQSSLTSQYWIVNDDC
jgi:hypothetical protein